MLNGELTKLAENIVAGMIMTPVQDLVITHSTDTVAHAHGLMGEGFDQLPVFHNETLAGIVLRDHLSHTEGCVGDRYSPLSSLDSIHSSDSLWDAIEALAKSPSCIVNDAQTGSFSGLLHYADLNRQAARVFCYLWTSALEMSLAELLTAIQPDCKAWIGSLTPPRQVQVLGRLEYSKRQNIEISPVQVLELSDLLNIWPRHSELLAVFSFSKRVFTKKTNHLIELRNAAMHPVRSLVNGHADVKVLQHRMNDLREMVDKSVSAIQQNRSSDEQ